MSSSKTIAFTGKFTATSQRLLLQLGNAGFRLLVLLEEEEYKQLQEALIAELPELEMEHINCIKDSCWEADLIIMHGRVFENSGVINTMKEVATQKPVLYIEEEKLIENTTSTMNLLNNLLPHSHIYLIKLAAIDKEATILSTNLNENHEVTALFLKMGYTILPEI